VTFEFLLQENILNPPPPPPSKQVSLESASEHIGSFQEESEVSRLTRWDEGNDR